MLNELSLIGVVVSSSGIVSPDKENLVRTLSNVKTLFSCMSKFKPIIGNSFVGFENIDTVMTADILHLSPSKFKSCMSIAEYMLSNGLSDRLDMIVGYTVSVTVNSKLYIKSEMGRWVYCLSEDRYPSMSELSTVNAKLELVKLR